MWEIHKSGSVRGIEVLHKSINYERKKEPYYVYSTNYSLVQKICDNLIDGIGNYV
jgi:hypothetical protein